MANENQVAAGTEDQAGSATDTGENIGSASATVSSDKTEGQGREESAGSSQAEDQAGDLDVKVPAELEEFKKGLLNTFYAKTRELAEKRKEAEGMKSKAQLMDQLHQHPGFRKWYEQEQRRLNGEDVSASATASEDEKTLSEEELETIKSDPSKFQAYMTSQLERLIDRKLGGTVAKTGSELRELREKLEIKAEHESASNKFSDFAQIQKSGLLDEYTEKGHNYETAYKLYKFDHNLEPKISVKTPAAAKPDIRRAQTSSSEKPSGGAGNAGETLIKGKTFDEIFDSLYEARSKGKPARYSKV